MYVVIDGNSLAYRAWYGTPQLSNSDPDRDSVFDVVGLFSYVFLYHSMKILKRIELVKQPSSLVKFICWDTPTSSVSRKKIYPEYKNRDRKSSLLPACMDTLKGRMGRVSDRYYVQHEDLEADDLIACFAEYVEDFNSHYENQNELVMVSRDKDLYQLLSKNVTVFNPFKEEIYNVNSFLNEFGFYPDLYPLYKAVVGDSSDNWPGVYKVGHKKMVEFLNKHKFHGHDHIYTELLKRYDPRIIDKGIELVLLPYNSGDGFLDEYGIDWGDLCLKVSEESYEDRMRRWGDFLDYFSIEELLAEDVDRWLA